MSSSLQLTYHNICTFLFNIYCTYLSITLQCGEVDEDYPVLYTAIMEDVDVLVTGDKDFSDIDVERPEIMTPAEFMDQFIQSDGNVVL